FVYNPLPSSTHTRLLTLLPGDGTSTIDCLLSPSDLLTKPHYEALSYVWGSVDTEYGILLDGKPFPVGPNLWVALYHLRDPITIKTLWIDAISINQEDDAEKAVQVRQMGNIYSNAAKVLAWLGPHSD
ncbi:HET-domain-containing protein, partial [Hyaloscypha variabilis F]